MFGLEPFVLKKAKNFLCPQINRSFFRCIFFITLTLHDKL